MIKYILLFASIISVSLPTYRPMSMRTIDFGENICKYREYDYYSSSGSPGSSYIDYVKPCQEGKRCYGTESSNYMLHTCENSPKRRKTIDESCQTDFECEQSLECSSENKCIVNSRYKVSDSSSGLSLYYCSSGKLPIYSSSNDFWQGTAPSCTQTTDFPTGTDYTNKFYVSNNAGKYAGLQPFKVPGKINFKTKQANSDYEVDSIELADIGSLAAGTPVYDERACESGFALYFYGNGALTKPEVASGIDPKMFLYCANLKEVLSGYYVYTLTDTNEKIYNTEKVDDEYSHSLSYNPNIETKLEMFKNYINALKPKLESCKSDYDYSEPYTCKNNEIRKWWYFYNKPEEYMLYKDHKLVVDYLVQDKYSEYASESCGFLALKYTLYLIILLLFL